MLLRSQIEEVYRSQKEQLIKADTGLERELLTQIRFDTNFVSIITGIRRSGKSTLTKQIIKRKFTNSCFLNFEDPRLTGFDLSDFTKLEELFSKEPENTFYIFDEIQNIPQWEKYIRHKQDTGKKILITGSNASLLSKELGTHLTGRHLDYELFPFSYTEFLKFNEKEPGATSFYQYLKSGGFPEYLKYQEPEILYRLTDDILYRDISVRYGIKNDKLLRQLLVFLMTNSGKRFSYNKLKTLFSFGSSNTIIDYISFFENSYLLFTVPKFSYSLKKQIYNPKKIYAIDTGIVNELSSSLTNDDGRKLENIIFLHLRKKYRNIFYFFEKKECDFVVTEKGNVTKAIQVCYDLNSDNLNREINGLMEAMEETGLNEGFIVTYDQEDDFEIKNKRIKVLPAWQFVM